MLQLHWSVGLLSISLISSVISFLFDNGALVLSVQLSPQGFPILLHSSHYSSYLTRESRFRFLNSISLLFLSTSLCMAGRGFTFLVALLQELLPSHIVLGDR